MKLTVITKSISILFCFWFCFAALLLSCLIGGSDSVVYSEVNLQRQPQRSHLLFGNGGIKASRKQKGEIRNKTSLKLQPAYLVQDYHRKEGGSEYRRGRRRLLMQKHSLKQDNGRSDFVFDSVVENRRKNGFFFSRSLSSSSSRVLTFSSVKNMEDNCEVKSGNNTIVSIDLQKEMEERIESQDSTLISTFSSSSYVSSSPPSSSASSLSSSSNTPPSSSLIPASGTSTSSVTMESRTSETSQFSTLDPIQSIIMLGLSFVVMCLCSLDRVAMSVAILPMANEYGYSETVKGAISSFFSFGYMTMMLPAGIYVSFADPKIVLAIGVGIWSTFQLLTPEAAYLSDQYSTLLILLMCRFGMGAAEAVATPTVQTLVGKYVDSSQKSKVVALLTSGLQAGTILAYLYTPRLIEATGEWRTVFELYGGLGVVWIAAWLAFTKFPPDNNTNDLLPTPAATGGTSTVDTTAITVTTTATKTKTTTSTASVSIDSNDNNNSIPTATTTKMTTKPTTTSGEMNAFEQMVLTLKTIPWIEFVTSKALWAVTIAHMAHNWGLYVMLAWLPTYFSQVYHLNLAGASSAAVLPWAIGGIVSNVSGWTADYLINNEVLDRTAVRKSFQAVGSLAPAVCMALLALGPESVDQARLLFLIAVATGSLSTAGFLTATQDMSSKYIGITYAATSALSVVAGSIGTYLTGYILDYFDHSWPIVFDLASGIYVIGAISFLTMFKSEKVFD